MGDLMSRTSQVYRFVYAGGVGSHKSCVICTEEEQVRVVTYRGDGGVTASGVMFVSEHYYHGPLFASRT
jgi:hypothetical protein